MKPQGWIFFLLFLALYFYFIAHISRIYGPGPGEAVASEENLRTWLATFLFTLPIFTAICGVILWKYFLTADFFEMPPIRYTREFLLWLQAKMRGEKRLWLMPSRNIIIPAPLGDDALRDTHLETLIVEKAIPDAEEYVREKLDWARLVPGEEGEREFKIYLHYMNFLIHFQKELER